MTDVDTSEYDKELSKMRKEFEAEEAAHSAQLDKKYSELLAKLSTTLGVNIKSFEELEHIDPSKVEDKDAEMAEILASEPDQGARNYAAEALLGGNNFFSGTPAPYSIETLRVFFETLPSDDNGAKQDFAAAFAQKIDDSNAKQFIELIELQQPQDRFRLIYGLANIKSPTFDDRIKAILKQSIESQETVWSASEVTGKKKYEDLLPDLIKAKEQTTDGEMAAHIQKAIDKLSK